MSVNLRVLVTARNLLQSHSFMFFGLEDLVEQLLVANARQIRVANDFGVKKVDRNIRALQQSIRTIGDGEQLAQFERARQYYGLFLLGPQVCTSPLFHA